MPYESTHFLLKIYRGTRISPLKDVNINIFKVIRILLRVGHLIMFYYYLQKCCSTNFTPANCQTLSNDKSIKYTVQAMCLL